MDVRTRFLVLSDTHGEELRQIPSDPVDVLIHCGDLTEESKISEFRKTIDHLRHFGAPLKLVIAGNHDWTLDTPVFKKKLVNVQDDVDPATIKREYGDFGEARALFDSEEAKAAGIVLLDEGSHEFELANGASLKVFASPYTPSAGEWGFQYDRWKGHDWPIPKGTDVVITHGPPKGIMDRCEGGRVGDGDLFAAVARIRPKMHCFGHIHCGWGARNVTWRKFPSERPSHFADVDNEKSQTIESLPRIEPQRLDTPKAIQRKSLKLHKHRQRGYCVSGLPPHQNSQTLFVNAAIEGEDDDSQHLPWAVDLDLMPSEKAEQTTFKRTPSRSPVHTGMDTQHSGKVAPIAKHKIIAEQQSKKRKREKTEGGKTAEVNGTRAKR